MRSGAAWLWLFTSLAKIGRPQSQALPMRRVPNHLFLEELTMQSDWTYFGALAALILFVYYLLDSRLSRIGDHILEIRRIVEKCQPKS